MRLQIRCLESFAVVNESSHFKRGDQAKYGVQIVCKKKFSMVTAPASVCRGILRTLIGTVKRQGNKAEVRRFSLYFVSAVQEHMKHHGED